MFLFYNRAVLVQHSCTVRILLTNRCYSASPVRLGALQRLNEKCEQFLEQRFPHISVLYRTLMRGFHLLFEDVKEVRRIKRVMRTSNVQFKELPYRDMERLVLFRRDMVKAVSLLVISIPPFAIGFVFLLMCLFPRQLLFRHFWTPQQQKKYQAIDHAKRAQCHAEILKNIISVVPSVSGWRQRTILLNLCSKVQTGTRPSLSELQAVREIFCSPPLELNSLEPGSLRSLGSQLPIMVWFPSFITRRRLVTKALELLYLDRAMKNLGLDQLSEEQKRQACDLRGLNPSDLSSGQCRDWLQQWLQHSAQIQETETSLFLHSMALLTLNYPPVPE
ncbi:LETM1 domain-containing protein 1-like [Trichomycterus rosablanca]|uniref:LETM1 domain-containing protein 1-like n=1 Tax=Trichomycterus rosablanca TaxID=2290929 RepID=UPI002F35DF95